MRITPLLFLLSFSACAPSTLSADQPDPQSVASRTAEFLFDPFDPPIDRSIAYGNSLAKVRARFGEPQKETSREGKSRGDPMATGEYLVWNYDGLVFHIDGPTFQTGRWIEQIALDGGDYRLKFGLGLKSHRRDFLAVLEPALLNSDERSIRFVSGYTDYGSFDGQTISVSTGTILVVDFDTNGLATKMTWNYYAD